MRIRPTLIRRNRRERAGEKSEEACFLMNVMAMMRMGGGRRRLSVFTRKSIKEEDPPTRIRRRRRKGLWRTYSEEPKWEPRKDTRALPIDVGVLLFIFAMHTECILGAAQQATGEGRWEGGPPSYMAYVAACAGHGTCDKRRLHG